MKYVKNQKTKGTLLWRYDRSGSQICFQSKNSIFLKKPEWPPNDSQMTPNDPQWPTIEHQTNPQWLKVTISWHIFGSQLLLNDIWHLKM